MHVLRLTESSQAPLAAAIPLDEVVEMQVAPAISANLRVPNGVLIYDAIRMVGHQSGYRGKLPLP